MKAFLMYHDRDFDPQQPLPWNADALTQDLELTTLFTAMARDDKFLCDIVRVAVLSGLENDLDTIRYRQSVLQDCLNNAALIREMYALAVEAIDGEKKMFWGAFSKYPNSILHRGVDLLQLFVTMLQRLRDLAEKHQDSFVSEGFTRLFAMLQHELSAEYFASIQDHLTQLQFRHGVLISAELGQGNKGTNYVLRKGADANQNWLERLLGPKPPSFTVYIADRDDAGTRAQSELRDRGINLVANALAQSTDHILSFFSMLRIELAFYVGCLNLHEQLSQKGEPVCFPTPRSADKRCRTAQELYDVCLALLVDERVVGNDLSADEKELTIISGANQGGKSTFLRSIGLAQLMMQSGMFVPAAHYQVNLCDRIFTHYKREEDATMNSGKLDEELSRMSGIVDHLTPHSLVLFNESFAATNEREGSEIARQIVSALLEKHIQVFFVTHLYTFAAGFYDRHLPNVLFLQPERQADGHRTYKIVAGEPTQTSYGPDLYRKVFGDAVASVPHTSLT
jgi:DNA mismatch repair ATPase MutS